jgi:tetratricopeptide (TPR) repeat protein
MKLLLAALLLTPSAAADEAPHRPSAIRNPVPVAATGLPVELDARIEQWARRTMRLVHEGRPHQAALLAERMVEAAPEDPRTHLLHARVLREGLSDQNHVRETLKPQVADIHLVLLQCIELSDRILEHNPESLHGLLYRGWGKMFKAQLHALAFERWSAGRTAKSGKKDLDELLKRVPDQGDALMVLGAYEYFADTLPAVARAASWLLRIPGGDRREGLANLERASETEAFSRDDARGIRGLALFGFEGAFEIALPLFEDLSSAYPSNPRFVEPIGLMALFDPKRLGEDSVLLAEAMQTAAASPDRHIRNAGDRIRLYIAMAGVFSGRIEQARRHLELLHGSSITEPDWFPTDIYRFLAEVHLMLGDRDRALALYAELDPEGRVDHEPIEKRLRFLKDDDPETLAASAEEVETLRRLQPIARALYGGRLVEAEEALDELGSDRDPIVAFYRGELLTLQGRDAEAIPEYLELTDGERPERWHLFRYFARLRLAEAYARSGDAGKAKDFVDDALDSHPTKDLLRHVTQGRKRWFDDWDERHPES